MESIAVLKRSVAPQASTTDAAEPKVHPRAHELREVPARFDQESLNRLMVHCTKHGASDIKITTEEEIKAKIHGLVFKITPRKLTRNEVENILNLIYGPNGSSRIKSGEDIDKSWELRPARGERYRFRINATGGRKLGASAIQITARIIASDPPPLSALGIEQAVIGGAYPKDGIVIVAGPTGSGKSTTLASLMRSIIEDPEAHKFILTYEAPIEYVYDSVDAPTCSMLQSEIGPAGDLIGFAQGIRNAMRRAPDIILVGESRDQETLEAAVAASLSGHAVYTTLHANSVADTIRRMMNFFPHEAQGAVTMDLIETIRMLVWQRLFTRPDGSGRVAVREFLVFDEDVRSSLLAMGSANVAQVPEKIREFVRERGQTMMQCARRHHEQGVLSERDLLLVGSKEA